MRLGFCLLFAGLFFFNSVVAQEQINKKELLEIIEHVNWERNSDVDSVQEAKPFDPMQVMSPLSSQNLIDEKEKEQWDSIYVYESGEPADFSFDNPAMVADSLNKGYDFLWGDLVYKSHDGDSKDKNFEFFYKQGIIKYSKDSWEISSQVVFDNRISDFNESLYDFVLSRSSGEKAIDSPNFGIGSRNYSYNKTSFTYAFFSKMRKYPVKLGVKVNLLTSISCFVAERKNETLGTADYYIANIFDDFQPSFGLGFGFGAQISELPGKWIFENGRFDLCVDDLNSTIKYKSAQKSKLYYNDSLKKMYVVEVDNDAKTIEYELEPTVKGMLAYAIPTWGRTTVAIKAVEDETAFDEGVSLGYNYGLNRNKDIAVWLGKGEDYFAYGSYSILGKHFMKAQGGVYWNDEGFDGFQISLQVFKFLN